jgi:hypothetical protein
MWKILILFVVSTFFSGCATGFSTNSGNTRVDELVYRLRFSYPSVKSISVDARGPVEGRVAGSRGNSACHISVDVTYLSSGVSDVELAFVLAHELAHCGADHAAKRRMFGDSRRYWEQEIEADRLAREATRDAGLGDVAALAPPDLPFFLKESHPATITHPAGKARLNALKGISIGGVGPVVRDNRVLIGRIP